jgi:death-on-curing protein
VNEPVWIDGYEVLIIHDRVLALHGGAPGVRDEGLLKSALSRPHQHYAYGSPSVVELAALYTAGIVRNHPFLDGNKRTGFVIGVLFLELNGFRFTAGEEDATQAVLAFAAGTLDEEGFAAWMKANAKPNRTRAR